MFPQLHGGLVPERCCVRERADFLLPRWNTDSLGTRWQNWATGCQGGLKQCQSRQCMGKKGPNLEEKGMRAEGRDWVWRDRNNYGMDLTMGCCYCCGKPNQCRGPSAHQHKRNYYSFSSRVIIKHIPTGWSETTFLVRPRFFQKPIKSFPKRYSMKQRLFLDG